MNKDQEQLLKDIHTCLIGNELQGQKGVLHRLETCEIKIESSDKRIDGIEKSKANKVNWMKIFSLGFKIGSKAGGM